MLDMICAVISCNLCKQGEALKTITNKLYEYIEASFITKILTFLSKQTFLYADLNETKGKELKQIFALVLMTMCKYMEGQTDPNHNSYACSDKDMLTLAKSLIAKDSSYGARILKYLQRHHFYGDTLQIIR